MTGQQENYRAVEWDEHRLEQHSKHSAFRDTNNRLDQRSASWDVEHRPKEPSNSRLDRQGKHSAGPEC